MKYDYKWDFDFINGFTLGFEHVTYEEVERKGEGWILVFSLGIVRILLEKEYL